MQKRQGFIAWNNTKRNNSFEETSLTVQLLSQWYIFEYKVMLVKNEKVQTPY